MPCFNQVEFLEKSVNSVLEQDYTRLELIIADGGSTDGTLEVLRTLAEKDRRVRWFSEKDDGPADAINKALARTRGTIIGWLNSDDLYSPGAIGRAVESFAHNPDWLMLYGHAQHIDELDSVIDTYPTLLPPQPAKAFFLHGCFICQPTVFFHRTLYVMLGDLDRSYKNSFDFAYWLRAFKAFGSRIGFVYALQAYSRLHADCITCTQRRSVALEGMRLLAHYFEKAPAHWLITYRDELLRGKALLPAGVTLKEEMESVLKQASAWLSEADKHNLALEFEIDLQ
jgi:glycosyltransferase involved in cell wall biosynthesis